jgi:hypothetical protein
MESCIFHRKRSDGARGDLEAVDPVFERIFATVPSLLCLRCAYDV